MQVVLQVGVANKELDMLPKITYKKLLKRLEQIQANWMKDAQTAKIPYCVRTTLRNTIDHLITQDKVRTIGSGSREALIDQTIHHLIIKNLVSSPLTGAGILYPVGSADQLPARFNPTRNQLETHVQEVLCRIKNDS